ncbi:MAG: glucosaminidase domain-containing protein [Chitinophagales bacterium]|nr:glucosaminidase domain-containing protein [Chitinophagales bacterium]MCB9019604.1 glucosaminidase domain-containing protein [Chitinophagales bacterium]MCB9022806.1 glucosaminidase domain-containing protein [Chitinophagales bacterium]HPE97550.1 glucosaminidase domain-containing protein [Chitinophagales bacterium]HQU39378.1 glucosaminidase domain-containing protein [Chitinophagales bacterium]
MKNTLLAFTLLTGQFSLFPGDPNEAVLAYIERYRYIAVEEMINHGIPASITLAQGILESGAGRSQLASESNNHFGIKCHDGWDGERVYHDDDAKGECFRKYSNPEESYRDHSMFLLTRQRYAGLFELDPNDYKGWAKGLKAAGYATNPQYADRLIALIEDYKLYEYDELSPDQLLAMEEHKKVDKSKEEKKSDADKKDATNQTTAVFYYNRIPTVVVNPGETLELLSERHNIRMKRLLEYNNMTGTEKLEPGTYVYLQPKRKKGLTKYHKVESGETMWTISRDEGVRLDRLYKYNLLTPGQEPAAGQLIYLRKERETAPMLLDKVKELNDKEKREEMRRQKEADDKKALEQQEEEQRKKNEILMEFEESGAPRKSESPGARLDTDPVIPDVMSVKPFLVAEELPVPLYHYVEPQETLYGLARVFNTTVDNLKSWNQLGDNTIKAGQQLIIGYRE